MGVVVRRHTVKFLIKATLQKQHRLVALVFSCSNSAPIQNSKLFLAGALVFRTYIIAHTVYASSCIFFIAEMASASSTDGNTTEE